MVTSQAIALEPSEEAKRCVHLEGAFACRLPKVLCPVCKHRRNEPYIEYPALRNENLDFESARDLSPEKFSGVLDQMSGLLQAELPLVPGALAGPFNGKVDGILMDIAWLLPWTPFASKQVVAILADEGVVLTHGRANLMAKNGKVDTHCVLQCIPAHVFDETTMIQVGIEHCAVCGNYRKKTPDAYPDAGYSFLKNLWPPGAHLVKPLERPSIILVSDEFAEAFQRHQFQGARLRCIGRWS